MSQLSNAVIEKPDVLTGHTEVICSTSIERVVTVRNAALVQIETLIHQLEDISTITNNIGGGVARGVLCRVDNDSAFPWRERCTNVHVYSFLMKPPVIWMLITKLESTTQYAR